MQLIDAAEVVAFDFDALTTRRPMSVDAVLRYVGFLLQRRDARLTGFFDRRKRAEWAARIAAGHDKDLDRGLIYAHFASDALWSQAVIAQALTLEIEVELGALAPRLDMLSLIDHAARQAKRKIIVSDTQLPRAGVMEALRGWNLLRHFDNVYLSSERSPNADPAGFHAVVAAKEAVPPAAILLIADDARLADESARPAGWTIAAVDWRRLVFAESTASQDWRGELILVPFVRQIASAAYGPRPGQVISITTERELGYVIFGPLLLAFMAWLFNLAALSQCRRLLFVSRQGYFLRDAYNRLRLQLGLDHLPEGEYVYLSPRLVLAASQAVAFDPSRILAAPSPRMPVADLLATRIGFRGASSLPLATEVSLPEDGDYLRRILELLEGEIVAQLEPKHADFMAYWHSLNLDDEAVFGLVDLGVSATTQAALQDLVGRPLLGLYLAQGATAEGQEMTEGLAFGCFQDVPSAKPGRAGGSNFAEHGRLLDALFTAPHGEVSHFALNAKGFPVPVFLDSSPAQKNFHRLQAVFAGAEAYCAEALSSWGDALLSAPPRGHVASLIPLRMLAEGRIVLADELAALLFAEG
jgi:FMN phosphatase YigB (HAD superfamily)